MLYDINHGLHETIPLTMQNRFLWLDSRNAAYILNGGIMSGDFDVDS